MKKEIYSFAELDVGHIYKLVGKNIKKYRKAKKMTSAELAEKINFSHGFLRQIESGSSGITFSLTFLYKVSKVLEVNIDNFFKE